jgi:hypothetical protein
LRETRQVRRIARFGAEDANLTEKHVANLRKQVAQ